MRFSRVQLVVVTLLVCVATAIRRNDEEEGKEPDIPLEPTLPKVLEAGNVKNPPTGNLQFSDKIPKHLAAHYREKGLDGIVYFSFCIA